MIKQMQQIERAACIAALWAAAATVILPLLLLLSGSLMSDAEVAQAMGSVFSGDRSAEFFLFAQYPTLRGYLKLLLDSPEFFVMFWNSCKLTFPILAGQLLVAAPAAWGFAMYDFPAKKLLFTLYIALMLMPFQVTMVSNYVVLEQLSLLNTRWAVILPGIFSAFPVFIICRFFQSVPRSLFDAAQLDGAGPWQIFWHIGLPLGAPGIASAAVLGFLEHWSAIEQPLTFLKDRWLWPLSLFSPGESAGQAAVSLAASAVTLLPPLLVFLMGKQYLKEGISASGLKE